MLTDTTCHNCGNDQVQVFYQIHDIPVHSCQLLDTRDKALAFPRGDLRLGFCPRCGFIQNTLFDPKHNDYASNYEETQGFSQVFSSYAKDLAKRLIKQHDLHGKRLLEIGCGKGEFITQMCEMGRNQGIGIDPAFAPERMDRSATQRIEFIRDLYSEKYAHLAADFICCRHTLEHIQPTLAFLQMLRRSIGDRTDTIVFFDVPDVRRVLDEQAFLDIYYEHCSYFSMGSLARMFRLAGFEILDLRREYDDQYLCIEARPVTAGNKGKRFQGENDLDELEYFVDTFRKTVARQVGAWRERLDHLHRQGKRIALWGSGSKAVAFLSTIGITDEVEYVVDINPYKHDMYMPGTGHKIVSPALMRDYQPDLVIAMNPVYCEEIARDLSKMGVHTELTHVNDTHKERSRA